MKENRVKIVHVIIVDVDVKVSSDKETSPEKCKYGDKTAFKVGTTRSRVFGVNAKGVAKLKPTAVSYRIRTSCASASLTSRMFVIFALHSHPLCSTVYILAVFYVFSQLVKI